MSALEQHRTAAIVVGAEPLTSWRPSDRRLRRIVDAIACVGASDVGLVLDELRAREPNWPWPSYVGDLLERWDERLDALDGHRRLLQLGGLVIEAFATLDASVDALIAARTEAEHALALANRASDLFEREARALGVPLGVSVRSAA